MSLEEAKKIRKNFNRRLTRLQDKSLLLGDKKAAVKIITVLTEKSVALKAIGFRETNTDGRLPDLVPITQEWIDEQLANMTKADKLLYRIRKGDIDAIKEFILLTASEEE